VIHIRVMTDQDLPFVLHLRAQAGWNQLETDLRRFLDLEPDGCFVAELDGQPAGTTTTCVFGPVAWVAMVLVEQSLRGRGLGTALMEHALVYLEQRGVPTIRLDATPLGQPVYEKLGFVAEYSLARFQGTLPSSAPAADVEPVGAPHLEDVAQLDQEVTGTDRRKLLFRLFEERPEEMRMVRRSGRIEGFLTARPGARATYIGPCLATAEAGPLLLADTCHRHAGETVFIDIPESHTAGTRIAEGWGLTVQRHLLRMVRGAPIREHVERLWASSGPEKG
jgi:GNAT superfamily N-acetyltransferase